MEKEFRHFVKNPIVCLNSADKSKAISANLASSLSIRLQVCETDAIMPLYFLVSLYKVLLENVHFSNC